MAKLSIIIPSRNEKHLGKTVADLLAKAAGSVECVICLEGYWPGDKGTKTEPLSKDLLEDKRVKILHFGRAHGMRDAINAGYQVATGEFIMKADGHVLMGEGYDEILKANCDEDWVVVPRRLSLDPEAWATLQNGKPPVDYHYLSNPFERPGDPMCGLHGTWFKERGKQRQDIMVDDEQSSQGSLYFMTRKHRERLGDMSVPKYGGFASEFQEVGNRTWLGGGAVKVCKLTTYHHWHKGKDGRGYSISPREQAAGGDFSTRYWMLDEWKGRQHDLLWLIEKFWPLPGWGSDPEAVFRMAREKLTPTGWD